MLKISILMIYLLSPDKGISRVSKFSIYKQKTDLKRNPTTKTPPEYTGPPILNVNWKGHPNLPEEVNNAEILKEIMQKVAEYKRYEYCPFSKKVDDCESRSVSEIVDRIIDIVLHPTEPPTEPPTPVNTEPPRGENNEEDNEEEKDNDETEGATETEENEGTDGEVNTTATTTEEGQESSTVEAASEDSEGEPAETPAK
ncbi:uncharacterized protein LOC113231012 [Hyposmocoma kahamanoa]|uniref:uncharacterized protein LOC113231012 n=1 Tax=Hyposmocoma kahamanoa TaxID=1477025 RepID=UPI000E6D690D|nr:uncharacterized protein LOC113231012 [Hyposmocoma kahamanoa]